MTAIALPMVAAIESASPPPRLSPSDETHAALADAREAFRRAEDEGLCDRSVWRVSAGEHLAMVVAVREAAAAGLTDDAINACLDTIWPTLSQMSGSDFFTTGPRRDRRLIRHYLEQARVEDTVRFIDEMSRLRWWVSVSGLTLLCLLTATFWLFMR